LERTGPTHTNPSFAPKFAGLGFVHRRTPPSVGLASISCQCSSIRTVHFRWRGHFGPDFTRTGAQTISEFFRALSPSLETVILSFNDCHISTFYFTHFSFWHVNDRYTQPTRVSALLTGVTTRICAPSDSRLAIISTIALHLSHGCYPRSIPCTSSG
jgi:hypothetical protein